MNVTRAAIMLNVSDVRRSVDFASKYFGFNVEATSESFASLWRDGVGFNLIFVHVRPGTFEQQSLAGPAGDGLSVVLVVDSIDDAYERLIFGSAAVVMAIQTEPWGERSFRVEDPNGIVYRVVQWLDPPWNVLP